MFWIDPINDKRWPEFVARHPSSSVFHNPQWLSALQKTYGFTPLVLTTSPPGFEITNGIPFCRVSSVLTGRRLVSLPFSDHCEPLSAPGELFEALPEISRREKLKYIELRPLMPGTVPGLTCSERYWFHTLDLRASLDEIFHRLHPSCIRRKIRRARGSGLVAQSGRSDALLDDFYSLQIQTRQRHGLPPQPRKWFRNLLDSMGEKGLVRVARLEDRPVAAILTLRHNRTAVYKYGCSVPRSNSHGGMQILLWLDIEDAKKSGMESMDLGRCDVGNLGLAEFKERWGAERKEISYSRYPASQPKAEVKLYLLAKLLPNPLLVAAGRLLYRHIA